MKKSFIILIGLLLVGVSIQAQQTDYYLKKGYVAEGYDVTEYFNNKAVEGDKKFTTEYDGVKFKFVSQANLDKFKANPSKYVPQYGGYCAYAVADKGKKISVDPKTFEIRDGKLYLFYNSWGVNTLEKWQEEGPEKLRGQADAAWSKVKHNK
ncbi:YHS domain-containing (seleno)protein [uncultured Dokdonia sp.]|uniref:YHS domain-containing (seleno)protein n=1 Tax=uncultured Dokdonia sp. TaxID=575653 RepID=UPI002617FB25|nr:YHS domain-containing (seleno)protein [uncultured Dokdonia sp.]